MHFYNFFEGISKDLKITSKELFLIIKEVKCGINKLNEMIENNAEEKISFFGNPVNIQKIKNYYELLELRSTILLSSFLLSIEQIIYNKFNLNTSEITVTKKDSPVKNTLLKLPIIHIKLSEDIYNCITFWIEVFLDKEIMPSLRILFIELLILLCETPEGAKLLSSESFFFVIQDYIKYVQNNTIDKSNLYLYIC